MSTTFILQNQDLLFYGKNKEWVDGYDANALYKTPYKDEAVNQMFEITSKDYKQRVKVLTCDLNDKGLPMLDSAIMPAPLPKIPKADLLSDLAPEPLAVPEQAETQDEPEAMGADLQTPLTEH